MLFAYVRPHNTHGAHETVRRLSSSGDFGLVLVHAAAHIQVDPYDMSNDLDPRFTRHFHGALKVLTQGNLTFFLNFLSSIILIRCLMSASIRWAAGNNGSFAHHRVNLLWLFEVYPTLVCRRRITLYGRGVKLF